MRYLLSIGFAGLVLLPGARASAEEAVRRARPFEVGVSSGYSVAGLGSNLSYAEIDSVWAVPLVVDVGYRISKRWSVGAYGEVGFIESTPSSLEDAEVSLSGHHYRLGAEAVYHTAPERRVQPWLGIGLGYDALRMNYHFRSTFPPFGSDPPDPGSSLPIRANGFEVGHVQLGIDFAFVPWLAFGPFVGASVVAYGKRRGFDEPKDDVNVWSTIALKATLRL